MKTTKRKHAKNYRPILKLPPLPDEQLQALRDNIALHGVLVPIVVDEARNIIDGSYRKAIAKELGYDCPEIIQPNLDENEKRTLARCLNLARRQLTSEQKRELIADQLAESAGRSNRWVAKQLGVHHATVAVVRGEMEAGGQIIHLTRHVGSDGKAYSVAKEYWGNRKRENYGHPLTLYPTPASVTKALLSREKFVGPILEPASGDNAMVAVLRTHGYKVIAEDINGGNDFLRRRSTIANIVTNPPYALSMAEAFVRHAMAIATDKIAMLLPFYFLEGVTRHELFTNAWPVKAVYVMSRRPKFGKQKHQAPFGSVWIVWERRYRGSATIEWVLLPR